MYFWQALETKAQSSVILTGNETISYIELARRADAFVTKLQAQFIPPLIRPLVVLETSNNLTSCLAYLGVLRAGWPVILVAPGSCKAFPNLLAEYRPNLVLQLEDGEYHGDLLHSEQLDMHPDLTVLLSTSGTTGAAKLVRLSAQNLQANAAAIVAYLGITPQDRAITALPFHYSYGMSVLHSHLAAGATLVLTEASVADAAFWSVAKSCEVTSLALVPTQFEILEKAGFTNSWAPNLRYMTQAGGRLDPILARRVSAQATAEGWQLFIMYGQTEAAPRMSYLPPKDAEHWFHSIGLPIPGGAFHLLGADGHFIEGTDQPGELVYDGPNVMMGYAKDWTDLAAEAGPSRLMTGDIAKRLENGYFQITGRASRFIKLFGLRIGLDEVETSLRTKGHKVFASGSDAGLVLFLEGQTDDPSTLRASAAAQFKLPQTAVTIAQLDHVPLMDTGKIDYRSLAVEADRLLQTPQDASPPLKELLQRILRSQNLNLDKSFVDHGGDSLSYLEIQICLSKTHGAVPVGWEHLPLRDLLSLRPDPKTAVVGTLDVSADLIGRVTALLAVIALHSTDWPISGGAYLLLILSGYSLARFQSQSLFEGHVLKTLRAMLVPLVSIYFVLITAMVLFGLPVGPEWFFLLGNFASTVSIKGLIPYWFVCAYAQIIVLAALPFTLPALRTYIRHWPLLAGLGALIAVTMTVSVFGFDKAGFPTRHHNPLVALELLLIGWCAFFAQDARTRLIVMAVIVAIFSLHWRDATPSAVVLMLLGTSAALWAVRIRLPQVMALVLMRVGSVALFTYLVHPPVISLISRGLHAPDALQFVLVVLTSLLLGQALKTLYERLAIQSITLWRQTRANPK